MTRPFETEVAAGVRWLDEHEPEWLERVDTAKLNMAIAVLTDDGCGCIGAQLNGDGNYHNWKRGHRLDIDSLMSLGFDCHSWQMEASQREWKNTIKILRKQRAK